MNWYHFFIYFIIFIKLVYIITSIGHVLVINSRYKNVLKYEKLDKKFGYWKHRAEFIFTACMAVLLIYLFRSHRPLEIDKETATLLFLFGWILLLTAEWDVFIYEAPWLKN